MTSARLQVARTNRLSALQGRFQPALVTAGAPAGGQVTVLTSKSFQNVTNSYPNGAKWDQHTQTCAVILQMGGPSSTLSCIYINK